MFIYELLSLDQGSTNKILNAYTSVRYILIRRTPSQGPRTLNITEVYVNSKYKILLTCFFIYAHQTQRNPDSKNRDLQKETK